METKLQHGSDAHHRQQASATLAAALEATSSRLQAAALDLAFGHDPDPHGAEYVNAVMDLVDAGDEVDATARHRELAALARLRSRVLERRCVRTRAPRPAIARVSCRNTRARRSRRVVKPAAASTSDPDPEPERSRRASRGGAP